MTSLTHPVWSICRLSIYMAALSFVLWLNAANFDETELKTIITMFLVGGGAEGLTKLIRSQNLKNPEYQHPMWGMLRLGIYMFTLCFVLWVNASSFDETEGKTIIWMFVVGAGSEGISQLIGGKQNQPDST